MEHLPNMPNPMLYWIDYQCSNNRIGHQMYFWYFVYDGDSVEHFFLNPLDLKKKKKNHIITFMFVVEIQKLVEITIFRGDHINCSICFWYDRICESIYIYIIRNETNISDVGHMWTCPIATINVSNAFKILVVDRSFLV